MSATILQAVAPAIKSRGMRKFVTTEQFFLVWRHNGKKIRLPIHANFPFDLATIPRFLWWLVPPSALGIIPPLVHDFILKEMKQRGFVRVHVWIHSDWKPHEMVWERSMADRMFFRLMQFVMDHNWVTHRGLRGWAQRAWRKWLRRGAYLGVRGWSIASEKWDTLFQNRKEQRE